MYSRVLELTIRESCLKEMFYFNGKESLVRF